MDEIMLKIDNVSKKYKLGQIGGTTLRDELQRKRAKLRNEEDPTKPIGYREYKDGDEFLALDGVSFEVKKGERVGIIGHNGAGKSTLLKLISRVTAPTEGTISLNGRVASMLEVGTGFHPELTGRENIYMNGAILGMTKKEIDSKIEDIIEFSECRQFIDTPVKRYSSGMYVKLAFSVAAHLDSEIMIMDEVLAVGDMAFQKKCLDKMNDVSRQYGRTILYVSHNMNTIRELCDRVIVLNHGKIIFNGQVEKGIMFYYNKTSSPTNVDLSRYKRKTPPTDRKLFLKELNILNTKNCTFKNGEKIEFRIVCISHKNIKNLGIRFEIECMGQIVGAAFSDECICACKGNTLEIYGELDTVNFAPGIYSATILTYEHNYEYGNQVGIDRVPNAINFKIEESDNDITWNSSYWGQTKFNNIKIRNIDLR